MTRAVFGLLSVAVLASWATTAEADRPQMAHVFPGVPEPRATRLIVGEGFDPKSTEVWVWDIPAAEDKDAPRAGAPPERLPAQPPKEARKAKPLDIEPQVIVCDLGGDAVWVRNADGWSDPVLINLPKPWWISHATASPGDVLHVCGQGLRGKGGGLVLRSGRTELTPRLVHEARAPRISDPRLLYFEVPAHAEAGTYELLVHNGNGGPYGWIGAGRVTVEKPTPTPERVVNVRDHGAMGDGLANDFDAISRAAAAAAKADGGAVFFPPGVYAVDSTLVVPPGTTLRGASREASIIKGVGYTPNVDRVAWFALPSAPTMAVVRLADRCTMESLSVEGAVSKGVGGRAPVDAVPQSITVPDGGTVHGVTIRGCRIRGLEEAPVTRRPLYLSAL